MFFEFYSIEMLEDEIYIINEWAFFLENQVVTILADYYYFSIIDILF